MAPEETGQKTQKVLEITKLQSDLVLAAKTAVDTAQDRLNLTLAAIVGGHGYANVAVVAIDGNAHTVTIEVPEKPKE